MTPAPQHAPEETKELAAVRGENRRLRRENKWHVMEVERLRTRVQELEAQLEAQRKRRGGRKRAATEPVSGQKASHFLVGDTIDWGVFYTLGSGMRILREQEKHAAWDFVAVDWSGSRVPKKFLRKPKFWSSPLALDWSAGGLPRIEYPNGRARPRVQSDPGQAPRVAGARSPATHTPKAQLPNEEALFNSTVIVEEEEDDELSCDWSGRWLPRFDGQCGGPRRRLPGPRGSRRGPRNAMGRNRQLDQIRCHLKPPQDPTAVDQQLALWQAQVAAAQTQRPVVPKRLFEVNKAPRCCPAPWLRQPRPLGQRGLRGGRS